MTAQILHSSALMRRAVSTEADDPSLIPHKPKQTISFCTQCGSRVDLHFVGSEHHWRHMCGSCGHIHYENPRNVVGCIVEHHGQILLCKRGIEPQQGLWTLPAGYMELHESSAGALRARVWVGCWSREGGSRGGPSVTIGKVCVCPQAVAGIPNARGMRAVEASTRRGEWTAGGCWWARQAAGRQRAHRASSFP